jgi:hypothetical protein
MAVLTASISSSVPILMRKKLAVSGWLAKARTKMRRETKKS